MPEDYTMSPEEVLGFMEGSLAPWVKGQIARKGVTNEEIQVSEGFNIRFYRDDTFTLSHEDLIMIFKY